MLTRVLLLTACGLACLGCESSSGGPASTAPSAAATRITVAGDAENRYPQVRVSRVQCGNLGGPDAFVNFALPAPAAPSTIQSELQVNVTARRANALTALDTLFIAESSEPIGRSGSLSLALQATRIRGPDGNLLSTGTLTVSGTYACP